MVIDWHLRVKSLNVEDKRTNLLSFIFPMSWFSTPSLASVPALCPVGRKQGDFHLIPLLISPSQQCHLFAGRYKWDWLEQGAWLICAHKQRDNREKIRPGGERDHSSEVCPALSCQKTLSSICVCVCRPMCMCEWLQDAHNALNQPGKLWGKKKKG